MFESANVNVKMFSKNIFNHIGCESENYKHKMKIESTSGDQLLRES